MNPIDRIATRQDWMTHAACKGATDVMFPTGNGGRKARDIQYHAARRICAGCPVKAQCLDYGLHEEHGMWGGLTRDERRELRRAQGVAA